MKSSEEDFRFKFRSLLEGYLKQLGSIDQQAAKEGGFSRQADEIRRQMEADSASAPVQRPSAPAAQAPPPEAAPPAPLQVVETPAPASDDDAPAAPAPRAVAPPIQAGEPDDLLADVESEVDDNEFKW
jgi:hypothetical protein